MAIDVLLADAHPLTLGAMRRVLERAEHIRISAEALTAADVLGHLKRHRPDVVLLELDMPDMDGLRCLNLLRNNYPDVKVILLSSELDAGRIEMALNQGAAACLLKSVNPADLPAAIRQAVEGTLYTSVVREVPSNEVPSAAGADLTTRERTMLEYLARGCSNKDIAAELWVTEQTVKFHLNNLYRKLGVSNRTAAARYAYEHGLAGEPAAG